MVISVAKHALRGLAFSAIPAFCSYAANSELFLPGLQERGIIGATVNISAVQDTLLWVGIVLSVVLLGGGLAWNIEQKKSMMNQRNALIQMTKTILASALSKCVGLENIAFDVRIFVPNHPYLYRLCELFHIKKAKKFVIWNISLIAQKGTTEKLKFEVSPKAEGLVGLCYNQKAMIFDGDLEHTNSVNYKLSPSQIDQTSNLMWSICCPVLEEDSSVRAIIALDGQTKITLSEDAMTAFRKDIVAFSRLLYDAVPQLFK